MPKKVQQASKSDGIFDGMEKLWKEILNRIQSLRSYVYNRVGVTFDT